MFGIIVDFVNKAQSDLSGGKKWLPGRNNEPETQTPEEQSQLYNCPSCDIVYVATEKTDCGNCDDQVVPVEADETAESE